VARQPDEFPIFSPAPVFQRSSDSSSAKCPGPSFCTHTARGADTHAHGLSLFRQPALGGKALGGKALAPEIGVSNPFVRIRSLESSRARPRGVATFDVED
jgi:hypothetical protein